MSSTRDEVPALLKVAIERLLATGEGGPLIEVLRRHPEVQVPCSHRFPFLHRIVDLVVDDRTWRILRCLTCAERICVEQASETHPEPGVPLWLTGDALAYWVRREQKQPSEGPVDWESIRRAVESMPIAELEAKDARDQAEAERAVRRLMGSGENPGDPFIPIDPGS